MAESEGEAIHPCRFACIGEGRCIAIPHHPTGERHWSKEAGSQDDLPSSEREETGAMSNAEIYASVTARILDCLSKGVVPWRKPWGVAAPRNLSSHHVYRGVNQILLSCTAFSSP